MNNETTTNETGAFEQMISDGNFTRVNADIKEENFPLPESNEVGYELTITVYATGKPTILEQVRNDLVKHESKVEYTQSVAYLADLCKLGKEEPRHHATRAPVIALGSVWVGPNGRPYVPVIIENENERVLDLRPLDDDFDNCAVLIRKKQKAL